ncbi:MAG: histidine kinase dimerization/phosphoacceptor domain -containing protein [Spirochaetia bacterium]
MKNTRNWEIISCGESVVLQEDFRKLLRYSCDPVFITKADGRIIAANALACTLFQFENKISSITYDDIDINYSFHELGEKLGCGDTLRYETQMEKGDGAVFFADVSVKPAIVNDSDYLVFAVRSMRGKTNSIACKDKELFAYRYLSQVFEELLHLPENTDFYSFLGDKLATFLPEAYIVVSSFHDDKNTISVEYTAGFSQVRNKVQELLGKPLEKVEYPVSPRERQFLTKGKLFSKKNGLSRLGLSFSEKASAALLEADLNAEAFYTMGISSEGELFGNVAIILKKGDSLEDASIVRSIVNSAAAWIQKYSMRLAMVKSKYLMKSAESFANFGSWDLDLETGVANWSDEFFRICGFKPRSFQPTAEKGFLIIHPEDRGKAQAALDDAIKTRSPYFVEKRIVRPSGEVRWVQSYGRIQTDKTGKPLKIYGSFLDITEKKRAEEQILGELREKKILLREVHHRVKNNLNVITSLLNLQKNQIKTKEDAIQALEQSRDRVFAMAYVHQELYTHDDFSSININSYISTVVNSLHASYDNENTIRVNSNITSMPIDINNAVPLGMIINELVTNAFKHAFAEADSGELFIGLKYQTRKQGFVLTVEDNGPGVSNDALFSGDTLGLNLVLALTKQLGGRLHVRNRKGLQVRMLFPALSENRAFL